jgi:hypothetical protein
MNPIDLANETYRYYRGSFKDMNKDNAPKEFWIYPWGKEIEEGWKYLEKRKNGGGIGDTGSWGVESTQELKNPMEKLRNCQWGSLDLPHNCSWENKSEKWDNRWRGKFCPG